MTDKYSEDKIETGLQTIKRLAKQLNYIDNDDLKESLWKLERETTLLRELIEQLIEEEEYKQVI